MVAKFSRFNPSLALDRIIRVSADTIVTQTSDLSDYLLLEALAQSCGLHLRWKHDFQVAAYLVSCSDLTLPAANCSPQQITATLANQTSTAACYTVTVSPDKLRGTIIIGYAPATYQEHFARRFECLLSMND